MGLVRRRPLHPLFTRSRRIDIIGLRAAFNPGAEVKGIVELQERDGPEEGSGT